MNKKLEYLNKLAKVKKHNFSKVDDLLNEVAELQDFTKELDALGINWHDISEFDEMNNMFDTIEEIRNDAYEHLKVH